MIARLPGFALGAMLAMAGGPSYSQDATAQNDDLTTLDLATLMTLDVEVTTVSRSAQSIYDIAAPVYVISAQDIRRSGAMTIPEALRMAPGLIVNQIDPSRWVVSARGFAWEYGNKVLILLDGRATYTPLNSSMYWETLDLPMESIDRIEVIRGPGDARWGSHAINGIVNIITRSSADMRGTHLTSTLDTHSGMEVAAHHGGKLAERVTYLAYIKYLERGDFAMVDSQPRLGDFYATRTGARLDGEAASGDRFVLIGNLQTAREGALLPVPGAPRVRYDPLEWSALGRWERGRPDSFSQQAQLSFDRIDQAPIFEERDTVDFAYQVQFPQARSQVWTLGASYKWTSDVITPNLSILPPRMRQDIYGAFGHNRIALGEKTALLVSSQFEHNPFTGWEIQPGMQLLHKPQEKLTYWLSVGRAVRAPLRTDDGFNLDLEIFPGGILRLQGNHALKAEDVRSAQAGVRFTAAREVFMDLTAFYNDYKDLIVQLAETPFPEPPNAIFPVRYANAAAGYTRGVEAALKAQVNPRWSVAASYSLYDESLAGVPPAFGEFTAIEHQLQFHSSATLLPALEWNVDLYYVGPLTTGEVSDYYKLDSQLAWIPDKGLQLRLGVKDSLSPRRREVGINSIDPPGYIPRRAYLQASWQF